MRTIALFVVIGLAVALAGTVHTAASATIGKLAVTLSATGSTAK